MSDTLATPADYADWDGVFLPAAFGKAELEFAAAIVILWHRHHGHTGWVPVTRNQLIGFMDMCFREKVEPLCSLIRNPFYKPDPNGLRDGGWISGWATAEDPGVFTDNGLQALKTPGAYKRLRTP